MKKEIYYKSKDNLTNIHAVIWEPNGPIRGILQISHGMTGHISTYERLAQELNKINILVCGNDTLGHGLSVIDKEHYGYFCGGRADKIIVSDAHSLTEVIKNTYPNIPYMILGHSMGSFVVRNYIQEFGNEVDGAFILGTSYQSPLKIFFAKTLTAIDAFYHHGWTYKTKLIYKITNGSYHKYFQDSSDPLCWLTKDKAIIEENKKDKLSNFKFTSNAYYNMFRMIASCNKKKNIDKIPKNLPIFLLSGKDDPVGDFGAGVQKVYDMYKNAGLNVNIKLYNNLRHAILDEKEKVIVYNDIKLHINTLLMKKEKDSQK